MTLLTLTDSPENCFLAAALSLDFSHQYYIEPNNVRVLSFWRRSPIDVPFFRLSYSGSISIYARPCVLPPKRSPLRRVASTSAPCAAAGPPTRSSSCSFQLSRILACCSHRTARCRRWRRSNASAGNPFWMPQQMPPLHARSKELLLLIRGTMIRNGCAGDGRDFSWSQVAQQ